MITVNQAAAALGLHRNRVLQFVYSGRLQAKKIGRDYLIEDDELARFQNINRPQGRPIGKGRDEK